jgi:hypothetical protein
MEETTRAWWKVWEKQKIQDYVSQPSKWLESGGTVNTGDIVIFLRKKKDLAIGEPVWRIGRVIKLAAGRDGQCRELIVEYRNADEDVFREVTLDSRQVAILHSENDLDLVDILNEASKEHNIMYHTSKETKVVGHLGPPLWSGIQILRGTEEVETSLDSVPESSYLENCGPGKQNTEVTATERDINTA